MSPRKAKPISDPQKSTLKKSPVSDPPAVELQRINKVLAAAGLGSRRHVDELIEQGRVEIDGKVITQVGVKVDMTTASISVDGEMLKQFRPVYFAVHKPEGVLCTNRDPQGRLRVIDFVPNQFRLFPVGRLDAFSTGLIILTNDGELAQQLTHPKHEIPKRYSVIVAGQVELEALKRLERGIYLAEGKAQVDHAKLKKVRKSSTEIEITLSEGKNREIRRVLARLGHKVVSLKRIAIGPLKLSDLPEGAYRPLSNHEVQGLYQAVEEIRRERKAARKARKKLASATQEPESTQQDTSPTKASVRKSTKAPKEKSWEKLPSLAQNPFATDDDFDDEDRLDDESQADLGLKEPLILVRDHGPTHPKGKDSDEEFYFMPRRPAGTVIGQEEASESDGSEFELNDPDDDLFEDESFEQDDSEPAARPPNGKRPTRNQGKQRSGSRRSEGAALSESQNNRNPKRGGPVERGAPKRGRPSRGGPSRGGPERGGPERGGPEERAAPKRGRPSRSRSEQGGQEFGGPEERGAPKRSRPSRGRPEQGGPEFGGPEERGAPKRGRPSRGRSEQGGQEFGGTEFTGPSRGGPSRGGPSRGGPSRGGPSRGGPKRSGPSRGGPKRGGPSAGGPKTGGPKTGGPKRGGPKMGGPKRGGPKSGGPKRGNGSGRGRSKS